MYDNDFLTNLVNNCIIKWEGEDEKTENFKSEFQVWFSKIPDEYKGIVIKLINKFYYYSHKVVNKHLETLHNELLSDKEFVLDKTIFIEIVSEEGIMNSSSNYWSEYKIINKLSKYYFVSDIYKLDEEDWNSVDNIVIIDDCCGSGSTILKFLKNNPVLSKKKLYYLTIHIMKKAMSKLISSRYNITIISINCVEKAFDYIEFSRYKKRDVQKFMDLSINHLGVRRGHVMGFNSTQSLMSFYTNTPNNTLGIFNRNSPKNKALFPRNFEEVPMLERMRRERMRRKKMNYNNRGGIIEAE